METWLNPIPAETVIGAIVGAILGSILERHDYLTITTWLQSFFVLEFIFLIISFGVLAHFHCAAVFLKKDKIKKWTFRGCALVVVLVLLIYPKHLGIGEDASISFLPHPYNALMSGLLVLWAIALRLLTQLKHLVGE